MKFRVATKLNLNIWIRKEIMEEGFYLVHQRGWLKSDQQGPTSNIHKQFKYFIPYNLEI